MIVPEYNPIQAIERIASEIEEFYPCASVGLLTAATAIGILLEQRHKDDLDRMAIARHWEQQGWST